MEEKNQKIGIYTRVSSDGQVLNGRSLEWQQDILVKYAEEHNYTIVDFYIESGISGDEISTRPELLRLLEDIKIGKINNLLVYKIDRLGRKVMTNSTIANLLEKSHCSITSSDFGTFDFARSTYNFIYNMLSSVSQFEVDNLSERVINGKKKRARIGLYINSNNVYGYDNRYDELSGTRLLKVNDYESINVKRIFKLYQDGLSMNKIAQQLQKEKIPCKRGGMWRQSTILQLLKNRLYIGKVIYKGNAKNDCFEVNGQHEPIIDESLFNKVQELISIKEGFKAKRFPNEYSYFSPYLVCELCGSKFKNKQTKTKDKSSIRYYCTNKACGCNSIKHSELENMFEKKLSKVKFEFNKNIIESLLTNEDYEKRKKCLGNLQKKQNEIDEMYSCGSLKFYDYDRQLKRIKDKIDVLNVMILENENTSLKLDDNLKKKIISSIDNAEKGFIRLTSTDKQNFINLFINNIKVKKVEDKIVIKNIEWKYKNQYA